MVILIIIIIVVNIIMVIIITIVNIIMVMFIINVKDKQYQYLLNQTWSKVKQAKTGQRKPGARSELVIGHDEMMTMEMMMVMMRKCCARSELVMDTMMKVIYQQCRRLGF